MVVPSPGSFKNPGVLKCPNETGWLDLTLPHFFSHLDREKLEVQVLREDGRPSASLRSGHADPGQLHTTFTGLPHTMTASSAKLQG
jgi:hypothetical protein